MFDSNNSNVVGKIVYSTFKQVQPYVVWIVNEKVMDLKSWLVGKVRLELKKICISIGDYHKFRPLVNKPGVPCHRESHLLQDMLGFWIHISWYGANMHANIAPKSPILPKVQVAKYAKCFLAIFALFLWYLTSSWSDFSPISKSNKVNWFRSLGLSIVENVILWKFY